MKHVSIVVAVALIVVLLAVVAMQSQTIEQLRTRVGTLSGSVSSLRAELLEADEQRLSGLVETSCLLDEADELRVELGAKSGSRSRTLAVTAYTASPDETWDDSSMAASNKPVRLGTVAVSQDLFKNGWRFGKKVYIDSLGVYEINDLVGSRHKRRIDVFMNDKGKALKFGLQSRKITLLE